MKELNKLGPTTLYLGVLQASPDIMGREGWDVSPAGSGTDLPEPAGWQEILLTVPLLPQPFPFMLAGAAFSSL